MKKNITCTIVLAVAVALLPPTMAQARHSFESGPGMPRGFMDLSVNGFLNLTLVGDQHFQLQAAMHESFAAKKSEGNWLALDVLAGYGLLRYDFLKSSARFVPYIAAGGALHFMTSFASKSGPVHDNVETKVLAKAQGFAGMEYSLGGRKFLSFKARFTYPSDYIFDAVYLNYGFRF